MARAIILLTILCFAAAAAAGAQPAPAKEKAAIIASVKAKLKDPDSAQFKGIQRQAGAGPGYYCGWVNAKNAYGGYTGFALFYSSPKGTALLPPELSEPVLCSPSSQ